MRYSPDEVLVLVTKQQAQAIKFVESGDEPKRRTITKTIRASKYLSIGSKCPTCDLILSEKSNINSKKMYDPLPSSITIEHVLPLYLGGDNKEQNLEAMCYSCNTQSRSLVQAHFIETRINGKGGKPLDEDSRTLIERFVEWSIRSIYTPNNNIDSQFQDYFQSIRDQVRETPQISIEHLENVIKEHEVRIRDLEFRLEKFERPFRVLFWKRISNIFNKSLGSLISFLIPQEIEDIDEFDQKLLPISPSHLKSELATENRSKSASEEDIPAILIKSIVSDKQIRDEFVLEIRKAFKKSVEDPPTIPFPTILARKKEIKIRHSLTWSRFYEAFEMSPQGSMSKKTKEMLVQCEIAHYISRKDGVDYAHKLLGFDNVVLHTLGVVETFVSLNAFGSRLSKFIQEEIGMERKEYLKALGLKTNISLGNLIRQELGGRVIFSADGKSIRANRRD